MRCTKTGRKCDGYLDPKSVARSRRRSSGQAPNSSLFFIYEWASQDEKRSFHFFQHVTAPTLSGDFDAFFWRVLVLQICQTEPAVKHAVLAVSSLHEGMLEETHNATPYADGSSRQSFALQQYNKAIACMLHEMTDAESKPLGPLLTCVLFVCIEFMQNKDKESLIHLEQGRQILAQLVRKASSTTPEMDMIKQHLVPMYTRLSLTSFMFGGNPVPIPSELKTLQEVPCAFESIDEAQYCLYDFMDECMRFTRRTRLGRAATNVPEECPRTLKQQQDYLMGKLAKIDVAWSLYQTSKPADTQEGAIRLLSVHLRLNRVCLATALSTNETDFDAYLPDFAAIIPLASSFLEFSDRNSSTDRKYSAATGNPVHPSGRRSMFSFGLHVIAPLYYVATKCRHPVIRRAALDVLSRNSSRRENLWRANIMAEIAARTIRLEEQSVVSNRSVSPPYHPFADPLSQGITPETILATALARPDNSRPGPRQSQTQEQLSELSEDAWFDIRPHRPSEFTNVTTSMALDSYSVPSLAGESIPGSGDVDMPIDPTLLLADTETSSPHSFACSLDDFCNETGSTSPNLPFVTTRAQAAEPTSTLPWQPIPCGPVAPSISLEPPTPVAGGLPPFNPFSHTPPRSDPLEHHDRYVESQHSSAAPSDDDEDRSSYSGSTTVPRKNSGLFAGGGAYNTALSREAPFDLPEHVRVHDVIIGPEKEDGSWIMMFRKLGGEGAEWDVTTEFVAI
ncbi:Transcriptional regulatory protein moc3 [Coniochaeta hoffmannii]|uniref:Transcriptional regulatory protein moc3 n=1 Tax=Coniochaeta hoffmannii TaxID=91930 RepID=A0AA38VXZ6_9PEZI|nr:Transcriptional regulatory protein moc3 [Coniochaeta hoffmannii]